MALIFIKQHPFFMGDSALNKVILLDMQQLQIKVNYLEQYDKYKRFVEDEFEMPDKMVALLVRFLEQNNGILSKRAREKEFSLLAETEVHQIEKKFNEVFKSN